MPGLAVGRLPIVLAILAAGMSDSDGVERLECAVPLFEETDLPCPVPPFQSRVWRRVPSGA